MRRGLPSLVTFALLATAAVALAQIGGTPPARAAAIAATGAFEISNSADGQPIFAATGVAPGQSTSGTVSIEDTGSAPVALTLRRDALVDTPGLGGGLLSARLELSVVDITEAAAPVPVYAGPLDSMPAAPAGELAPGEARTYKFTATLPEGGAPAFQNAVQGAATVVDYSWIATEAASGGESGGPPTEPPPGGGVNAAPSEFRLLVPRVGRGLRGGRLVAWVNCAKACRLDVRGRLRAAAGGTHGGARIELQTRWALPAGARRVRIPVPRRLRIWLRNAPAPKRLRAHLRFLAVGTGGERDAVRRALRLRVRGAA